MNKKSAIAYFAMTIFLMCSSACRGGNTEQNYRDFCVNSASNLCRVPYAVVIGTRASLLGKVVSTKGLLVKEGGDYILYESTEQARYGIREGAIAIAGRDDHKAELDALSGRFVIATGLLETSKDCWASLRLDTQPTELPEQIEDYPPAPERKRS